MGASASVRELAYVEMQKPEDGSDLNTVEEARAEVARLRKLVKDHAPPETPEPVAKRMIIIIFGPPGSGKGTRSPFLSAAFGIPQLSTGDILRDAARSGSDLGKSLEEVMKSGALVEDQLVVDLVKERIQAADCEKGFILDGFPRTLEQARLIDTALYPEAVTAVVALDVQDEVLVERICGRWIHRSSGRSYHVKFNPPKSLGDQIPSKETMLDDETGESLEQRADDTLDALKARLETYHAMTVPLLQHYEAVVVKLDANENKPLDEVQADMNKMLESDRFLALSKR